MTGQCPPIEYFYLLVAVIGTTCIEPSVSTSIYSNSLLQLGLEACNEQINYCTIAKKSQGSRPCCAQCSCRNSCYEKEGCCPDIANTTFRFKHSCQSVYYENSQFFNKQDEVPKRSYEMVTKCPDGRECKIDHTETGESVSLDDIVVVYNEEYKVIFQNKKCAKCNGITDFVRWRLISSDCLMKDNKPPVLSSEELLRYILDDCILFSYPRPNMETKHQQCDINDDDMIDACNVTGNWDVYDQNVENACLDKNLNFPAQEFGTSYKNVYCFLCNSPNNTRLLEKCYTSTWDRFTTEFVQILDLQTDFSPTPDGITNERKCKDNEIFDEFYNTCRLVSCPALNLFSNGLCKILPVEDQFLVYKLNIMLIPSQSVPSNKTAQHLGVDILGLHQSFLDVSNIDIVCPAVALVSVTASWDRETGLLYAFYLEILVTYQVNYVNCTYESLVKVLNRFKEDKALTISVSVTSESKENITFMLAPDNRTQMFDSFERLWPNNRSYVSVALYKLNRWRSIHSINVEVHHVCPYVMLNESEFCKLVSENQHQSCISKHSVHSEYKFDIHTYVHSYENYLDGTQERYVSICLDDFEKLIRKQLKPNLDTVMGFLSLILSCISMSCAMMLLLLFCLAKKITNAPMVIFVSALVNLFIAQGVFQFGSGWSDKYIACQIIGIAVHYFWLATVFALNAYCVLILRKILSISSRICSKDFVVSILYVYGLPVLFVMANIIYTNADTTNQFASGYGAGLCHINTALMRGILFALPILLTVVVNGLINGMIAFKINRIQTTVSGLRKDSRYAAVYFRLLMVTGLTWIFGLLKELVKSLVLDYCFSLFVGGQGIMLLMSFVCKKHFFQDILSEIRSRKPSSFVTKTSMSSNMSEKHQNKSI